MPLIRVWLPVVAVLLLGYFLRVYTLGDFDFNWDEGYSNWIVSLPYGEMIQTTAADVHPPLYYQMLRVTQSFAGSGEFVNRYPSALLGVITLALTYGLGRSVGGHWVGVIAALLLAISRASIDIAQLSRMHMIAAMFATGGLWMTVLVWRNPRRLWPSVFYILCIAGALYSFYLAAMFPLATNLGFVFAWFRMGRPRELLLRWAILQIVAGLLFLPWAVYAIQLMHGWQAGDPLGIRAFLEFYAVTLTTGIPAFWQPYRWSIFGVTVVIGVAALYLAYTLRRSAQKMSELGLLAASVLMPAIIVFLLILPIHNLGRPLAARYLPLLIASFFVLVAWSIVTVARKQRIVAGTILVSVIALALTGLYPVYGTRIRRDNFISVSKTLEAHRGPDDALVFHADRLWPHLYAVYPEERLDVPYRQVVSAEYAELHLRETWETSEAVWLLQTPESLVNDPTREIESWLADQAVAQRQWAVNGNMLTVYARTEARADNINAVQADVALPDASDDEPLLSASIPLNVYPVGDDLALELYWSSPPQEAMTVDLVGEAVYTQTVDSPPAANNGPTRQLVTLPLTSEMAAGVYDVVLNGDERTKLGSFTLVNHVADSIGNVDDIQHRLNWRFGETIELLGYDLNTETFSPNDRVEINMYWRIDEPLTARYKVLVYIIGEFNPDSGNPLWGEQDNEPLSWQLPTTQWPVDTVIRDPYRFRVYEKTPPGEYGLGVVVYHLVGGERLLITDAMDESLGDTAIMQTIRVR